MEKLKGEKKGNIKTNGMNIKKVMELNKIVIKYTKKPGQMLK